MEKNITFAPNVLLLDVAFLNETVCHVKHLLAEKMGRELPVTDWIDWLVCLALDGGLRGEGHELQVLLVADEKLRYLNDCQPSDLSELDGKACRTPLGEFSFSIVPSAGLVSRADLFVELTKLALDAKEVECLLLVPDFYGYGEKMCQTLNDFGKEAEKSDALDKALCFLLEKTDKTLPCRSDLVTYSLMHIWGVTSDDL